MFSYQYVYSECTEKQVKKYISYIKKVTSNLKTQALEDVRLLNIMIENKCLIPEMIDDYFLEADRTNNVEAKAILLSVKENKEDDVFELWDEAETADAKGKTFVVADGLRLMSIDEFAIFVANSGGKLSKRVSSKTDYLICNDLRSDSPKLVEAKSRGIKIITEEEFYVMAGKRPY